MEASAAVSSESAETNSQPNLNFVTASESDRKSATHQLMRVCLLGASPASDNRGVAALATGAITAALHTFPRGQVFLLDYGRSPERFQIHQTSGMAGVELVNIRFSKQLFLRNNVARLLLAASWYRLLPSKSLKAQFASRNPVLAQLMDADVIGSIAGGDSFSDIYGLPRLLYVALPQLLVLVLGRPLVLLPQTLGPFKGLIARQIARYILRRAAIVYSRDEQSIDDVRSLVGPSASRFRTCCDLAFAMVPFPPPVGDWSKKMQTLEAGRPLVGLNVSGLLYMGGYSGDNMFGLQVNYRELIHAIVRFFVKQGANVLLVPHVFGRDSEGDPPACAAIHRELGAECAGHLHLLEGNYDAQEIKHVIGRCDFFLGSRMHACIAALSQCVPAIGLAYSRKFRGVFRSIRVEEFAIDLHELDAASVLQRIAAAYESRAQIRGRLEQVIPGARDSVLELFSRFSARSHR